MKTQRIKFLLTIAAFITCILATSCSTEPSLPPDQLATIRCVPKVVGTTTFGAGGLFPWEIKPICQIDGRHVKSSPIKILPGQHIVYISYLDGNQQIGYSGKFDAVAGHHYIVNCVENEDGLYPQGFQLRFAVQEDVVK